jgi:hypothetical protein
MNRAGRQTRLQPKAPFQDSYLDGFDFYRRHLAYDIHVYCPAVLVRRQVYDNIGGFDPLCGHSADEDMWLRIGLHYDIVLVAEPVAEYRFEPLEPGAMTAQNWLIGANGEAWHRILVKHRTLTRAMNRWAESELVSVYRAAQWKFAVFCIDIGKEFARQNLLRPARTQFAWAIQLASNTWLRGFAVLLWLSTFGGSRLTMATEGLRKLYCPIRPSQQS